jgi:hypothetical protein
MENGSKNPMPQATGKKGGKGKGGSTQRNLGKRKADDTSKLPCHNWSRGNGFCKYADACRYSHDGPKGGSNQSTTMAVTTKKIKKEKKNKPSLVITEYEGDGEEHNNSHNKTVSWKNEEVEEDHLYELIRGVPAVIVSNRNSQSNKDFIPKRNLIGRKNRKIRGKQFFGQKDFFPRLEKKYFLSEAGETEFNVSFDGSFSQSFEDTQFIVSLQIINGLGSSQLRDYLPKRGEDSSESSSKSDDRTTGERGGSSRTSSYLVLVAKNSV